MNDNKIISERIKESKSAIIATNDKKLKKRLLDELLALQRQECVEPVEFIVPTKEVLETKDFGACRISRTIRGFLFEAKGGMQTFVGLRMANVCDMIRQLFLLIDKADKTEDEKKYLDSYRNAILYCFQSPLFASLGEAALFDIATANIRNFNEYAQKHYVNAEVHDETEEDIKANISAENITEGIKAMAESPLPPE